MTRLLLAVTAVVALTVGCSQDSPTGPSAPNPPASQTPPPPAPLWTHSGIGNTVFDMPTSVGRVRIKGRYTDFGENFIVKIGGRLVVNVILGTCTSVCDGVTYDGVHLTNGGGVTEITSSNGVEWTFTEVR